MPVSVYELRLSSVWIEPFVELVPPDAPMSFLGNSIRYEQEFERAKSGLSSWKLPWPKPVGHNFWEYYLGRTPLNGIGGDKAWKYVLPLLTPSLCKPQLTPSVYFMGVEGYHYPSCIGVVISIGIKCDLPLGETVRTVFDIFRDRRYSIEWSDGTNSSFSVRGIATEALNRLRKTTLGDAASPGHIVREPYTIATVIDGIVDDPKAENPSYGDVHRALEALCRWHPLWEINPLHSLDEATCYRFKDKDCTLPSHLLYGLERGRAIWFPGYFGKRPRKKIRTLGCYHRNLTMATLQTASLITLMELAATYVRTDKIMPPMLENLSKAGVTRLSRLYGASKDETYRSISPYRQIKDGGFVDVIDLMRSYFFWPKLKP